MKRKLLFIVLAVVMAVACSLSLMACNDDKFEDGTYDLYFFKHDSASNKDIYVKTDLSFNFKDGTVYCNGNKAGTYTVEKKSVNLTLEGDWKQKEISFGKSTRGGWTNLGGAFGGGDNMNSMLCKQGSAPENVVEESEYYNQ